MMPVMKPTEHVLTREGDGLWSVNNKVETERGGGGGRFFQRRRPCRFCIDKGSIDFKDVGLLRNFLTERGRIVPRRISGNCMRHQRELTAAVKRARHIALISFAEER